RLSVTIAEDGSFSLEIPERYPGQEIWFWLNDDLYYANLWVRQDLHLTIDYTELKQHPGNAWEGAKGVTFSGTDGLLAQANIDHFSTQEERGLSAPFAIIVDRELSQSEKLAAVDSAFAELRRFDDDFLTSRSPAVATVIRNNRESDYFGFLSVLHWNEDMPADILERYLAHHPLLMSNSSRDYYKYFAAAVNGQARRQVKASPDSTEAAAGELLRQVDSLLLILDNFPPARADLIKLYQSKKDPTLNFLLLEKLLPTVTTPWIAQLMEERYQSAKQNHETMLATLAQMEPIATPAGPGAAVGTLDFGANLYTVPDTLTGKDLLAQLRGAFPGKALYLDLWAVWCGPCLQQLPFSAQLHPTTEGLPLKFVYLCTDSGGNQEQWQNLIANHRVPGTHVFVPNKAHRELLQLFSGRGYPTYVLLQPDGTPVLDLAWPSELDREKLADLIAR
ncbi:MAG: TlpA disulfide reductase family protein, partial [Bacteroidota bacterium]